MSNGCRCGPGTTPSTAGLAPPRFPLKFPRPRGSVSSKLLSQCMLWLPSEVASCSVWRTIFTIAAPRLSSQSAICRIYSPKQGRAGRAWAGLSSPKSMSKRKLRDRPECIGRLTRATKPPCCSTTGSPNVPVSWFTARYSEIGTSFLGTMPKVALLVMKC